MPPVPSSDLSGYADAGALVAAALAGLLPRQRLGTHRYALAHRRMTDRAGRYALSLDLSRTPYLVEPMEACDDPQFMDVTLPGPGQCGKTLVAECWAHRTIVEDPANMLWYLPTDPVRDAYVKDRINPLIAGHDDLDNRLGTGPTDSSLKYKRFGPMSLQFLAATRNNIINKTASRIVGDEIDAYDGDIGDPKAVFDVRRQVAGNDSMLLTLSHPDLATGLDPDRDWNRGIMAIYKDSTRGTWWWPCPRCGAYSSPNPGTIRPMTLVYEDGQGVSLDVVEQSTRLKCPVCTGLIEDAEREGMNAEGFWSHLGEEVSREGRVTGTRVRRRIYGAWIVGVMSPFILAGIGGLARSLVKAEREAEETDEFQPVKEVTVKQLGHPYTAKRRQQGSIDAIALAGRCEDYRLGIIPPGVLVLIAAVDVQKWGFSVLMRGFGFSRESWIVDRFEIRTTREGEALQPDSMSEHWDVLIDQVLLRSYPLADGSGRRMRVLAMGYDSAGEGNVTEFAADTWRRWRAAEVVRNFGRGPYGELQNVYPVKGMSHARAAKMVIAYPELKPTADRPVRWHGAPLVEFNPDLFKDELASQLSRNVPGPGYVHFSQELRAAGGPPHPFFEELTAEERDRNGHWEPKSSRRRNETLDLMNISSVVARAWGMREATAAERPWWAAEWDRNPMVVLMTEDGEVLDSSSANAVRHANDEDAASAAVRAGFLGGRRRNFLGRR